MLQYKLLWAPFPSYITYVDALPQKQLAVSSMVLWLCRLIKGYDRRQHSNTATPVAFGFSHLYPHNRLGPMSCCLLNTSNKQSSPCFSHEIEQSKKAEKLRDIVPKYFMKHYRGLTAIFILSDCHADRSLSRPLHR